LKGLIASVAGDAVDYVAGSVGFEPAKGRLFRVFARRKLCTIPESLRWSSWQEQSTASMLI
jgi:hypothetical protein